MKKDKGEQRTSSRKVELGGNAQNSTIIAGNGNIVYPPPQPHPNGGEPKVTALVVAIVLVALILVVGCILWRLLSVSSWVFPLSATPVQTHTLEVADSPVPSLPPATATSASVVIPQDTPSPALSATPSVVSPASPSATPQAETMVAILQVSRVDGKAPFEAKLDARSSYIHFADGRVLACETGFFCAYRFTIYRDNKYVESLTNDTGVLTYHFGRKGMYQIGVYVCRGEVCGEDGVVVTAR